MAGCRARHLPRQACHGTRGKWKPAPTWMTWRRRRPGRPRPRVVWGDEAAVLICVILSPAPGRWRVSAACSALLSCVSGEDARVTSQPGMPGVEPGMVRCGPAIGRVIAVAGAARPGDGIRQTRAGRSPGVAPGAAAPGLARLPQEAAGEQEPGTGQGDV